MTHTTAAYLFILSLLGVIEQTRDEFISAATQQALHIDKIRLPVSFWLILMLCVVTWRVVDHSYREISQRDSRIEEYEREFSGKWE